jgi:hypothetical protein
MVCVFRLAQNSLDTALDSLFFMKQEGTQPWIHLIYHAWTDSFEP